MAVGGWNGEGGRRRREGTTINGGRKGWGVLQQQHEEERQQKVHRDRKCDLLAKIIDRTFQEYASDTRLMNSHELCEAGRAHPKTEPASSLSLSSRRPSYAPRRE